MNSRTTQVRTVKLNDIEMSFRVGGEGDPLVLLHGGGGVGANWDLVFGSGLQGYRLVVPDLRGHGRSTNPTGRVTFRQCALDVFALLDHLEIGQVKAIGMSLGAKTLLHMATQQPSRVDAMVLVSGAPYLPEQARSLMRDICTRVRSEAEWTQMRAWHDDDEQIRALWRMAGDFADTYDDLNFTPPYLSTITAQTLIVHGDRDELYPVRLALEMYESIPHSYLWVVPNGRHGPIFGTLAEPFVSTVMEFLGGRWGDRGPDAR